MHSSLPLFLIVALAQVASAASITLQQGVSPTSGYQHVSYDMRGTGQTSNTTQMSVGLQFGGVLQIRGILGYDLSAIPSGSTIDSIILTVTVDSGAGTAANVGTVNLHQLTPNGSVANIIGENQANWTNWQISPQTAWTSAGGDFGGVLADTSITAFTAGTPHTFASSVSFVAAAQSALNAGAPLQMILISPNAESLGSTNFVRFASNDHATTAYRPQLTINYTVPEPSSAALLGLGVFAICGRRKR